MGKRPLDEDGHLELEEEIAWGEEVAKGLGESAVAEDAPPMPKGWRVGTPQEMANFRLSPAEVEYGIRLDERRKAEQEITARQRRHGHIMEWMREEVLRGAYHHDRFAPQPAVAPIPGHDLSEAREEVGGEGDRPVEQAPAKENESLRPCPFCGDTEALHVDSAAWVGCDCGSVAGPSACGKSGRAFWNTRPIEDRLRAELGRAEQELSLYENVGSWQNLLAQKQELSLVRAANRELEKDHAQAMALVLAHEGRIENQVWVIDQLLDEKKQLQQQLAEEKQYNAELEKRLDEHPRWSSCQRAVVRRVREHADTYAGRPAGSAVFRALVDLALEIEEGQTIRQIAGDPYPDYDQAFDRAQLRAETEVATAGRIADWLARRYQAEILPEMIREGAWRGESPEAGGGLGKVAPDNDPPSWGQVEEGAGKLFDRADDRIAGNLMEEVFTEELGRVVAEQDPGDWRWARQMALALVRWSISLSAASNGVLPGIRSSVGELLSLVERGIDQEENK
jgi:hypothetical protein